MAEDGQAGAGSRWNRSGPRFSTTETYDADVGWDLSEDMRVRERRSKDGFEDKDNCNTPGEGDWGAIIRIKKPRGGSHLPCVYCEGSLGLLEWTIYETMRRPCRLESMVDDAKGRIQEPCPKFSAFARASWKEEQQPAYTFLAPGTNSYLDSKVRTYLSTTVFPPLTLIFSLRHRRRRYDRRRSCQAVCSVSSDQRSAHLIHFLVTSESPQPPPGLLLTSIFSPFYSALSFVFFQFSSQPGALTFVASGTPAIQSFTSRRIHNFNRSIPLATIIIPRNVPQGRTRDLGRRSQGIR